MRARFPYKQRYMPGIGGLLPQKGPTADGESS